MPLRKLGVLWFGGLMAVWLPAGCGASDASGPSIDVTPQIVGEVNANVPVTIVLSGPVGKPGEFNLPSVDGLTVNGSGADPNTNPPSLTFFVTPGHAGDFTIPAFSIHSDDGKLYHVQAVTLHATGG
jgi:hypothetical protein